MSEELVNDSLEDLIKARDSVLKEIKKTEGKIDKITKTKLSLWKDVADINKVLKVRCEHKWKREAYFYAPLYCEICGVER